MRILVACEFSGRVRDAFIKRGFDAMSCDLLDTEALGPHYKGDVMEIINDNWDLMICHPPCTYLTISQAWTFYHPEDKNLPVNERRAHPKFPDRWEKKQEALNFCKQLFESAIPMICMENPVGFLNTEYHKPDQIIQPWQFGHPESKKTCLWLKNLPKLLPTNIITERTNNLTPSGQNKLGPSPDRWKIRSRTYEGIAEAMAGQWGHYLKQINFKNNASPFPAPAGISKQPQQLSFTGSHGSGVTNW